MEEVLVWISRALNPIRSAREVYYRQYYGGLVQGETEGLQARPRGQRKLICNWNLGVPCS